MNKDTVVAMLTGFGIGAGIGLLFAPRSGVRTRVLLARKTRQQAAQLKSQASQLKNQANALRDSAADLIDRGQQEAMRQKEGLMRAVETGKRVYRQAVS